MDVAMVTNFWAELAKLTHPTFLRRTGNPTQIGVSQRRRGCSQVCDDALESVRAHDQGVLLATGSHGGATTLLELSSSLYSLQRNEKSIITAVRTSTTRAAFINRP